MFCCHGWTTFVVGSDVCSSSLIGRVLEIATITAWEVWSQRYSIICLVSSSSQTAFSWAGSDTNKRIKERVATPAAAHSSLYRLCTEEMQVMWQVLTGNGLIMIQRDVQQRTLLSGCSNICCHMIGSEVFSHHVCQWNAWGKQYPNKFLGSFVTKCCLIVPSPTLTEGLAKILQTLTGHAGESNFIYLSLIYWI